MCWGTKEDLSLKLKNINLAKMLTIQKVILSLTEKHINGN